MLARHFHGFSAMCAAIAWILAWSAASAQDAGWTVSEVSGSARIEAAGQPARQAEPDLAVSPGARITTDDGGRLSLTNGASVMTLTPATEIEIREAPEAGKTSIFQRIGVLMLQVERRAREHFEVETPYLAAVVKGTRFSVSVAAAGAAVHVTDGMVEVSSPAAGAPILVHPGQTATIDAGALDVLRLDGGRSENVPSERGVTAQRTQDGDSGANLVIRRAIGDASVDMRAATKGLLERGTARQADTGGAEDGSGPVGGLTRNTELSLTGTLDGATSGASTLTTSGTTSLTGSVGGTVGGVGDTVGSVGSTVGGTVGALGNTVESTTSSVANTTSNLGGGLGNLLP